MDRANILMYFIKRLGTSIPYIVNVIRSYKARRCCSNYFVWQGRHSVFADVNNIFGSEVPTENGCSLSVFYGSGLQRSSGSSGEIEKLFLFRNTF